VDPLDGTKEYIAGRAEFTVNIALIEEGRPVVGVVAAPALGFVYAGVPGAGAWRDSGYGPQKIEVSPLSSDSPLRVVASRSHFDAATQAYLAKLGPHLFLHAGSSLKFCRVAEGAADLYPRLSPTCEWDTAAAQAVLEGAGGQVACMDGSPLRYGKPAPLNPPFIAIGKGVPHDHLLRLMDPTATTQRGHSAAGIP
jgi:3'(2'), 5'-bisphosphate nucleotidase